MEQNKTDTLHDPQSRLAAIRRDQPMSLLVEANNLPTKVATMNAKLMLRINPILEMTSRFSDAAGPYVACKRGCNHCCHIQVAITRIEAQLLGNRIGVNPAPMPTPQLRPQDSYNYKTPCTFLENGECSIYEDRPYVCRAHASLEANEDPCRLTDEQGHDRNGKISRPNFPGVAEALNVVLKLAGKTDYADIRDYFPNGRKG
jgi:hypothetical protein